MMTANYTSIPEIQKSNTNLWLGLGICFVVGIFFYVEMKNNYSSCKDNMSTKNL